MVLFLNLYFIKLFVNVKYIINAIETMNNIAKGKGYKLYGSSEKKYMNKKDRLHFQQEEHWYPPQYLLIEMNVIRKIIPSINLFINKLGIKMIRKFDKSDNKISIPYLKISLFSELISLSNKFIILFDMIDIVFSSKKRISQIKLN